MIPVVPSDRTRVRKSAKPSVMAAPCGRGQKRNPYVAQRRPIAIKRMSASPPNARRKRCARRPCSLLRIHSSAAVSAIAIGMTITPECLAQRARPTPNPASTRFTGVLFRRYLSSRKTARTNPALTPMSVVTRSAWAIIVGSAAQSSMATMPAQYPNRYRA